MGETGSGDDAAGALNRACLLRRTDPFADVSENKLLTVHQALIDLFYIYTNEGGLILSLLWIAILLPH